MRIDEVSSDDLPSRYNTDDDQIGVKTPEDTRKPTISLRELNRIKRLKKVEAAEWEKRQEIVELMFGEPVTEDDTVASL